MIEVIKLEPEHCNLIKVQQSQKYIFEKIKNELSLSNGYTIKMDGEVIFIGGFTQIWLGYVVGWCILSESFAEHFMVIRHIKKFIKNYDAERVEINIYDNPKLMKWAFTLGFKPEIYREKFLPSAQGLIPGFVFIRE